jgi:hypothetical protein
MAGGAKYPFTDALSVGTTRGRSGSDHSPPSTPTSLAWCQQLPRLLANAGQARSRRPRSVRPARVPSEYRQVIFPGAAPKVIRVGTSPWWTSESPTTLRACSSARGPGLLHRGVPPQASPIQPLAGQGVSPSDRSPAAPLLCSVARWRTSPPRTCVLFYTRKVVLSTDWERRVGAIYKAEPIPWGRYTLSIECTVRDAKSYRLRLRCVVPAAGESLEGTQEGTPQQETEAYQCEWEGAWGEGRTLRLPQLTISSI